MTQKKPIAHARGLLLLFTLLGLVASGMSAYVHAGLVKNPGATSACDINATVNCTAAYLSPYGSFVGIPVALLGLCFFAGMLLLVMSPRLAGVPNDHVPAYVFAASVPALAFTLYLGYATVFVLHTVCPLCVMTYVATAGLFLVSGMTSRVSMTTLPTRLARDLRTLIASPVALVLTLLFVAGAASALAFFPRESAAGGTLGEGAASGTPGSGVPGGAAAEPAAANVSEQDQAQLTRYLDVAPRSMIPVDVTAPVVIVKFNDYQCPPCKQTYETYKPLKAKWDREAPGKVKWISKDFPLENECNAGVKTAMHQYACEAAVAVRLARKQGKAEALEDWLFANQTTLTADGIKKAVRDIGGVPTFDQQYAAVLTEVRGDAALGGILGVNSTPTFYINGIKLPALPADMIDAAIAHELKKTGK